MHTTSLSDNVVGWFRRNDNKSERQDVVVTVKVIFNLGKRKTFTQKYTLKIFILSLAHHLLEMSPKIASFLFGHLFGPKSSEANKMKSFYLVSSYKINEVISKKSRFDRNDLIFGLFDVMEYCQKLIWMEFVSSLKSNHVQSFLDTEIFAWNYCDKDLREKKWDSRRQL